MIYLESTCTDPRWNLALEEHLFSGLDRSRSYFMLWQNHNTVVIGKNQNTVAEINLPYVEEHNITVVRRLSGGGAVYHDLGNLNFTFVTDADKLAELNFSRFCLPVLETLRELGVPAQLNGRNDMTIDGKKFSGNSQYIQGGRVLHHGTLLFRSDLEAVAQALQVDREKIQSKGIPSVRSRVTNISSFLPPEATLDTFKKALLRHILGTDTPEPYVLSPEDLARVERLQQQRYNQWSWNYGYSPQYQTNKSRRLEGCGRVEVCLTVKNGTIQAIRILGDFFGSGDIQELESLLLGCPVQADALAARLEPFPLSHFIHGISPGQLAALICG